MSQPLAQIAKNSREVLCVSWETYEGHTFLDLRIYYRDGEALKPTRKGVAIPPRLLGDLVEALVAARVQGGTQ